jgi:hypothetical protein
MGRDLIIAGFALVTVGLLWNAWTRLPGLRGSGDWVLRVGDIRIHVLWAASLLLSVVLSLFVWLFRR